MTKPSPGAKTPFFAAMSLEELCGKSCAFLSKNAGPCSVRTIVIIHSRSFGGPPGCNSLDGPFHNIRSIGPLGAQACWPGFRRPSGHLNWATPQAATGP